MSVTNHITTESETTTDSRVESVRREVKMDNGNDIVDRTVYDTGIHGRHTYICRKTG